MEKIKVPLAESKSSVENAGDLVIKLMHSRTWTHLKHLSVPAVPGSLAEHTALAEYYEGIVPLIDRLVECAQGIHAQILTYPAAPFVFEPGQLSASYLDVLRLDIEQIISNIPHPALNNIMSEILELLGTTLYKLHFLR